MKKIINRILGIALGLFLVGSYFWYHPLPTPSASAKPIIHFFPAFRTYNTIEIAPASNGKGHIVLGIFEDEKDYSSHFDINIYPRQYVAATRSSIQREAISTGNIIQENVSIEHFYVDVYDINSTSRIIKQIDVKSILEGHPGYSPSAYIETEEEKVHLTTPVVDFVCYNGEPYLLVFCRQGRYTVHGGSQRFLYRHLPRHLLDQCKR